jgi:hypothetical protein
VLSDLRGIYRGKVSGGLAQIHLGKVLPFVLTPGIFNHCCCSTVLSDFKVGARGVVQAGEHLFCKHKVLSSNPRKKYERGSLLLLLFSVLGFELKAYTLSHSTSPFL